MAFYGCPFAFLLFILAFLYARGVCWGFLSDKARRGLRIVVRSTFFTCYRLVVRFVFLVEDSEPNKRLGHLPPLITQKQTFEADSSHPSSTHIMTGAIIYHSVWNDKHLFGIHTNTQTFLTFPDRGVHLLYAAHTTDGHDIRRRATRTFCPLPPCLLYTSPSPRD